MIIVFGGHEQTSNAKSGICWFTKKEGGVGWNRVLLNADDQMRITGGGGGERGHRESAGGQKVVACLSLLCRLQKTAVRCVRMLHCRLQLCSNGNNKRARAFQSSALQ
ncbi:hypothetical protein TYRP_013151 [Tyrophagus putrescentiae]|nr:hypothetical protein TYRP_013151 [Tyrophagus putrescentiae]